MNVDWNLLLDSFWPIVLGGIKGTIPLALVSFVLGLAIALLMALMRISNNRLVSFMARAYISVIREPRCWSSSLSSSTGCPPLG